MRRARFVTAGLLASAAGCALLGAAVESPVGRAVIDAALARAGSAIREHAGRKLDDVPMTCEVEHHPDAKQVLMLCTMCYGLRPGEACR